MPPLIKLSTIDPDTSECIANATGCIQLYALTFQGGAAHPRFRILEVNRGGEPGAKQPEHAKELAKVTMFEGVIRRASTQIDLTSPFVRGTVVYASRKSDGGQVILSFKVSGPMKHEPTKTTFESETEVIELKSYGLPIDFNWNAVQAGDAQFAEYFVLQSDPTHNHELAAVLDVTDN